MPRYKTRSVEIEAVQFDPDRRMVGVYKGDGKPFQLAGGKLYVIPKGQAWIMTMEGPKHLEEGDWIVTGSRGEVFTLRDEAFRVMYEQAAKEGKKKK